MKLNFRFRFRVRYLENGIGISQECFKTYFVTLKFYFVGTS